MKVPNSESYHTPLAQFWVRDLHLHTNDREDILGGAWLNDRVIDAVNSLIATQLGTSSQSTLLKQTPRGFKAVIGDHTYYIMLIIGL